MKFNWGTGIFIFYSLFATSLFYQVYKSTQYDHNLVVDNYYEKDLDYQSQFDKIEQTKKLKEPLTINYLEGVQLIELAFPNDLEGITGTVLFYRASDKKMDVTLPITIDNLHQMILQADKFPAGFWRVEVDWEAGGNKYFTETAIKIVK